jgi:hypothetical protein
MTRAPSTIPRGPGRRCPGGRRRHLLEDQLGDVLGPVDLTGAGVGGHDHARRPIPARQPGAVGVGYHPVLVVDDVLAEVPDRPVIGLGIRVQGHLEDAPAGVGDVLVDAGRHRPAVPVDRPGPGKQHDLGPERLAVHRAELEGLGHLGHREQRVGDLGRREHGRGLTHSAAAAARVEVGTAGSFDPPSDLPEPHAAATSTPSA